jgi:hypothetical protein
VLIRSWLASLRVRLFASDHSSKYQLESPPDSRTRLCLEAMEDRLTPSGISLPAGNYKPTTDALGNVFELNVDNGSVYEKVPGTRSSWTQVFSSTSGESSLLRDATGNVFLLEDGLVYEHILGKTGSGSTVWNTVGGYSNGGGSMVRDATGNVFVLEGGIVYEHILGKTGFGSSAWNTVGGYSNGGGSMVSDATGNVFVLEGGIVYEHILGKTGFGLAAWKTVGGYSGGGGSMVSDVTGNVFVLEGGIVYEHILGQTGPGSSAWNTVGGISGGGGSMVSDVTGNVFLSEGVITYEHILGQTGAGSSAWNTVFSSTNASGSLASDVTGNVFLSEGGIIYEHILGQTGSGSSAWNTVSLTQVPYSIWSLLASLPSGPPSVSLFPSESEQVIQNVQVENVYWGQAWTTPATKGFSPTGAMNYYDQFMSYITNSTFMDMLGEYGAGRGSFLKSYIDNGINSGLPTGVTSVSDAQIQAMLQADITNNELTAPNANTVYCVYTPPGVEVTAPFGLNGSIQTSGKDFSGYHVGFIDTAGEQISYIVIPYLPSSQPNLSTPQSTTLTISHELAEAVTDPQFWTGSGTNREALGWTNRATYTEEIADIAETNYSTPSMVRDNGGVLNGYQVTAVWSNWQNQLVLPQGATPLTTNDQPTLVENLQAPGLGIFAQGLGNFIGSEIIWISPNIIQFDSFFKYGTFFWSPDTGTELQGVPIDGGSIDIGIPGQ